MNKAQNAKLDMYEVLLNHLQSSPEAVGSLPAFAKAVAALDATVKAILATVAEQNTITTGAKQSKDDRKATLAALATSVANSIYSYADDKQDSELKAKADISPKELQYLSSADLRTFSGKIYEWAVEIGDALAPYGITPEVLNTLKAAKEAYSDHAQSTRSAIAGKAGLTKRLKELFTKADDQVEAHLDKLVDKLKNKWPDYHTGYGTARVVVNPAASSRKPSGKKKKDSGKEEESKAA